jgi:hypothetical protein
MSAHQTSVLAAAKVRKEPTLTDAAHCTNVRYRNIAKNLQ